MEVLTFALVVLHGETTHRRLSRAREEAVKQGTHRNDVNALEPETRVRREELRACKYKHSFYDTENRAPYTLAPATVMSCPVSRCLVH